MDRINIIMVCLRGDDGDSNTLQGCASDARIRVETDGGTGFDSLTPRPVAVSHCRSNRDLVLRGCHLYLLRAFVAAHHTETRFATGPHVSPHRVDGFLPLRRRRRRRACRAVAPLGVALGVSSIAHHQMCRAHLAAIGLGGAARDPPRVRRGRRAPRHRHRVVHQGGARVRAPPARYVPNAKPRPAYAPRARTQPYRPRPAMSARSLFRIRAR